MNCPEYSEILLEIAREQSVPAGLRAAAKDHASDCAMCLASVEAQRSLTAGLAGVAEAALHCRASPALEAQLAEAFAKEQGVRRRVGGWMVPAAVAAGVIVAVVGAGIHRRTVGQLPEPLLRAKPAVAVSLPAPKIAEKPAEPVLRAVRARAPRRKRRVRGSLPGPEVATDFFALPYAEALTATERAEIVRVKVPRASLVSFGLPVNGSPLDERVQADVVLGQDGIARAIRLVR